MVLIALTARRPIFGGNLINGTPMRTSDNPLLAPWNAPYEMPPFQDIALEHYRPAYEAAFEAHKNEIAVIVADPAPPNFENVIEAFERSGKMVLVIAPEGTRGRTRRWKTGFYYIALGADVPIVLGFIDYGLKNVGFGPTLVPSGDIEADMKIIRGFYEGKEGKHPDKFVDGILADFG